MPLAVLGTIGTLCWCVQLGPQIWRNWRTKSTEGLPAAMMCLWSASGVPFGSYAIVKNFNVPLQVQPQCFCLLCGVSWCQCLIYGRRWRTWTAVLLLSALLLASAALQAGLVLAIRPAYGTGVEWPVLSVGIVAFVFSVAGFSQVPFELLKRRGRVVGIDFVFLGIDWAGACFSLLSLAAQGEFDALFGSLYAACCAIEMGVVASHLVWRLRTRELRREAATHGLTFDESPKCMAWQAQGVDLGRTMRDLVAKRPTRLHGKTQPRVDEEQQTEGIHVGK